MNGIPPVAQLEWQQTVARFIEWLRGEFLSFQWQVMLALFIVTAWLWWKKVDKARLAEMAFYTALIIIFVVSLDEIGDEMSLWYYTVDMFPLFPPITAIDFSCLPLVYMLIYQHTRHWKTFILATALMSVIFCFIAEPIFVWSGIYVLLHWQSLYGLPIYFLIGVASRFVIRRIYHSSGKKPA